MKKLLSIAMLGLMIAGLNTAVLAGPDTGIFTGYVIDAELGTPVDGALVFLRICPDPDNGLLGNHIYSATTNEFGEFYIDGIPEGEWDAIAKLKGVGRDEEVVLIEAGSTTVVTFELEGAGCPGGLQQRLQQGGN